MLVLTRRLSEAIAIGNDITITVMRIEGGAVRLAIEAPREVPVVRLELLQRTHNKSSGQNAGNSA